MPKSLSRFPLAKRKAVVLVYSEVPHITLCLSIQNHFSEVAMVGIIISKECEYYDRSKIFRRSIYRMWRRYI